jgi:hypothetical protein
MSEVLVVLGSTAQLTARDLAEREPFVAGGPQLFGSRVLIVSLNTSDCESVATIDGVSGVYEDTVPDDADLPDDPIGKLAVQAWNLRKDRSTAFSPRVGDGVAWDDPRFQLEGRPGESEGRSDTTQTSSEDAETSES